MIKIEDKDKALDLFSFLMGLDMHGIPAGLTENEETQSIEIFYDSQRVTEYEVYKLSMIRAIMDACLNNESDSDEKRENKKHECKCEKSKYEKFCHDLLLSDKTNDSTKYLMIQHGIFLNELSKDVNGDIREAAKDMIIKELQERK